MINDFKKMIICHIDGSPRDLTAEVCIEPGISGRVVSVTFDDSNTLFLSPRETGYDDIEDGIEQLREDVYNYLFRELKMHELVHSADKT